jgi:phage minor structural protein
MDIYVFDKAETLLYIRDDAKECLHAEETYLLECAFPLTENIIERGMFVGFYDIQDVFQMFEVRGVVNSDPEMMQELSCEHVAMADLLDDVVEETTLSAVSAATAGAAMLADSRWEIGMAVATDDYAIKAYYETAWIKLCEIRDTWGVRIKPRIVLTGRVITGRYINLESSTPVFNGVRLEIKKNMEHIGVTIDDRNLYTALFGRGQGLSTLVDDDTNAAKLTFSDSIWTIAGGDPANKPAGQKWVEDTAATAIYGRNGRKRTGVAEFPDITTADDLLQATWDYLQTINTPQVTIDCTVLDLYSYGYSGEPMLWGDEVAVIDDDLGVELKATVNGMQRDYIHPEKSVPIIGNYRAGLDYLVKDALNSAGTVQRMTNSNPELVNGFAANVTGMTGTFNEIVQKSPTNVNSKVYVGEYNNKEDTSDPHSGVFWGGQKAQYIAVDSYGILTIEGDAGLVLRVALDGAPLIIRSEGDIHLIPGSGCHVYAGTTQLD